MATTKKSAPSQQAPQPSMDAVLTRMLNTPPTPFTPPAKPPKKAKAKKAP